LKVSWVLLIVLAVLIVVFAAIRFGGRIGRGERPLYPEFEPAEAARLVIQGSEATAVFTESGDVWFVASEDSLPAEAGVVEDMLTKVAGFSRKDIISSNPEKRALYKVDSTGVFVSIMDALADTLVRFVVGKPGPDYQSTYVRDVGTGDVVLAPGYLRAVFDRGTRTWQDRTVFEFEPDAIDEVRIDRPGETFTLERDAGGEWYISEPESTACDQPRVTRLVRTLAYLRGDDLAGRLPSPASGLAEPDSSVGFRTTGGLREELVFGNTNERGQTYAKRSDSDIVYLLSSHRVTGLLPRPEELRAAEAPGEGEAEVGKDK
jgi:hypothetical protein